MSCRTWERTALAALVVALAGCGGGDSPQSPDGAPVVILDATSAVGWTGTVLDSRRDIQCFSHTDTLTSPQSYWQTGRFIGGVRVEGVPGNEQCCNGAHQKSTIRSAARFDLSQYTSARVQCRVRTTLYDPSANNRQVTLTARSNVPGLQDLQVFRVAPDGEQSIDLSLQNALSFQEASFELTIETGGGCLGVPGLWSGDIVVEVLDFKIAGARR
jgi:hypothetical protein